MRERWQTVSRLWEENKALANNLKLLGQLDYMGKLSSQLEWQQDKADRPVRVVYTSAGQPYGLSDRRRWHRGGLQALLGCL